MALQGTSMGVKERLPLTLQSGEPREIRLHSVGGLDFGGASISGHLSEWCHRWNILYEVACPTLIPLLFLPFIVVVKLVYILLCRDPFTRFGNFFDEFRVLRILGF